MNVARGMALVISGGFPHLGLACRLPLLAPAESRSFHPRSACSWVCAAATFFWTRTTAGRDIYAIGGNKQAQFCLGSREFAAHARVCAQRRRRRAWPHCSGRAHEFRIPLAGAGAELESIAAVIIGGASFFGGVGRVSSELWSVR